MTTGSVTLYPLLPTLATTEVAKAKIAIVPLILIRVMVELAILVVNVSEASMAQRES